MHWVIEPGFFGSQPVQLALGIGAAVAVVSAIVGVFTVLRGQSFAGHALTDVATAGGSAAFLLSLSPVVGFVGISLVGAASMDAIGVQRVRGRDLATGIVLGAATGLAALILYFDTTSTATTGAAQQVLFGSIFTATPSTIPIVAGFGAAALGLLAFLYRPLLLASANPDLAAARGVPVRLVGVGFLLSLAVAVGLSSLVIGTILSTALLIGPAAAALRITRSLATSMAAAAAIGVAATWIGVLLAYDSVYWTTNHNGFPVSFFIVAVTFVAYLLTGIPARRRTAGGR